MAMLLTERLDHLLEVVQSNPTPSPDAPFNPSVVLATVRGILADANVPTRNGRYYLMDLWEMVVNDELFQESLVNKVMFVESDHPANWEDRLEPHIPYAVGVVREVKLDNDRKVVEGVIDILDTPHGRIIKTFLDYGSRLGVSSRGSGDVIIVDGKSIVDKSTYNFVTWDIVARPANKSARVDVDDSPEEINEIDTISLTSGMTAYESLSHQISKYKKINDSTSLAVIKGLIESTCIPQKDKLLEEVVMTPKSSAQSVSTPPEKMGGVVKVSDGFDKKFTDFESRLKQFIHDELKVLIPEPLEPVTVDSSNLNLESTPIISTLCENDKDEIIGSIDDLQESTYKSINRVVKKVSELLDSQKLGESVISQVRKLVGSSEYDPATTAYLDILNDKIDQLTESIGSRSRSLDDRVLVLTSENSKYREKLSEAVSKSEGLDHELSRVRLSYQSLMERYVRSRCSNLGINESVVSKQFGSSKFYEYSVEDVDQVIDRLYESGVNSSMSSHLNEGHQVEDRTSGLLGKVAVHRPDIPQDAEPEDEYIQSLKSLIAGVRAGV